MNDEFWAPRLSFLSPIPEVAVAADLLALAADSLLACNEEQARSYLDQANMPTLRAYTRSIASQVTREIHRLRDVSNLPVAVPKSERGRRQPSAITALNIYHRDGFRCRYCGCRVVSPQAQSVISALLPGAVEWGARDTELNAAFYTLKGVLDHVDPHAHGGTSESENIVVACQPCNYGKGNYFFQELGLSDPRLRSACVDGWDGLLRVLPLRPVKGGVVAEAVQVEPTAKKLKKARREPLAKKRNVSINEFTSAFSVIDRCHLDSLLQALDSCRDFGVFWKVNKVLLANIDAEAETISAIGIEADGTVQVPWSIGPYKQAFRPFAETLAAALPGGEVYETEKMWRVRCFGRFPRVSDLIHDPEAVHTAFKTLHHALNKSEAEISSTSD